MPSRVTIRPVRAEDGPELIAANLASMALHEPWVSPCRDEMSFMGYLARCDGERSVGFVARERSSGRIAGIVNLSEIVRGFFQSAYMGYYGMAGMNGRGLMREAVGLVVTHAFEELDLHRVSARCDERNTRSYALMERIGMRREAHFRENELFKGEWGGEFVYAVLAREWAADVREEERA